MFNLIIVICMLNLHEMQILLGVHMLFSLNFVGVIGGCLRVFFYGNFMP